MQADTGAFIRLVNHRFKFPLFLFSKIPSAFFSGVRIREISEEACTVAVPYKWFSQNPFRSTYFACLAMAAELSTGALLMAHTYKSRPSVSILVTRMEAQFHKKASGTTLFVCADGLKIREALAAAVQSGQAGTISALSTGQNERGETVAEFRVTWSFKARAV
ncbi:MAG: DUF4442 domain-containing protein [Williamsia sp.]|nr:DUF4442 domain-containing protein [Williamsia sp.]